MGIFGSIWKGIKGVGKVAGKVGKAVGKVGKVAVPILAATTGMGIPLSVALGAGSGLLSGGGVKGALTGGLTAGGAGLAGKALGTKSLLGKVKNLITGTGQTGPSQMPGLPTKYDPVSGQMVTPTDVSADLPKKYDPTSGRWITPVAEAIGTGQQGGGLLSKIGDFIKQDPARAAGIGLAAGNLLSGAGKQGAADTRLAAARQALMEPEREDLSDLYADAGNPYARPRRNRALDAARLSLAGGY